MPYNDEMVTDPDGNRFDPSAAPYREEARSRNLGNAAQNASYGAALDDAVAPHSAEHTGTEAFLEATEPERSLREQLLAKAAQCLADIADVPLNAIARYRKAISFAGKAGFVIGDTAVLANQLYRASTPLALALVVGVSLAVTVVMIGTQCGHELAAANQRHLRGSAPAGALAAKGLYDSGEADDSYLFWLKLAAGAAAAMFLSLFFLGRGSGDPGQLALGYGLLGALTVAGSACAEAYATNDAAEQLKGAEVNMNKAAGDLAPWGKAEYTSASSGTTATLADIAARHLAVATGATVAETSDRLPDTPAVGGYIDGGHIPLTPALPVPTETPVLTVHEDDQPARSRKRPAYSIVRISEVEADSDTDINKAPEVPGQSSASPTLTTVDPDNHALNGAGGRVA
jgi:hypothetical protein